MIRTLPRGATREALVTELARIEALEENDPSWLGVTEPVKENVRVRIGHLDRKGHDRELRREDLSLDPNIFG